MLGRLKETQSNVEFLMLMQKSMPVANGAATRTARDRPPVGRVFESVQALLAEHGELQEELADPALHADAARAKKVNRRYAELSRIVAAHAAWQQAQDDLEAARELAKEDDAFAEEVPSLEEISRRRRRSCGASSSRATPTTAAT